VSKFFLGEALMPKGQFARQEKGTCRAGTLKYLGGGKGTIGAQVKSHYTAECSTKAPDWGQAGKHSELKVVQVNSFRGVGEKEGHTGSGGNRWGSAKFKQKGFFKKAGSHEKPINKDTNRGKRARLCRGDPQGI